MVYLFGLIIFGIVCFLLGHLFGKAISHIKYLGDTSSLLLEIEAKERIILKLKGELTSTKAILTRVLEN